MNLQKYIDKYKKIHDGSDAYLHEDRYDTKEISTIAGRSIIDTPFTGFHTFTTFAPAIKYYTHVVLKRGVTILDYGSGAGAHLYRRGKANQEKTFITERTDFYGYMRGYIQCYWCYDPAYPPFSKKPPDIKFDIVTCCDVLEHVPEDSIDYVLDDIKKYTDDNSLVLFTISGQEALRSFSDGENFHCSVKPVEYWHEKITKRWSNFIYLYEEYTQKTIVDRMKMGTFDV